MSDFEIEGSDEESHTYGYTPSPRPQKGGSYSTGGGQKKIGSLAFDDNDDDDGDVYNFEYEENVGKSNRNYGGTSGKGRIAAFSPAGGKGNFNYNARQPSFSDDSFQQKGDANRGANNNLRLSTVSNESSALDRAKNIMDRYANKTFEAPKSNFKGGRARHFDEDDISIDDDDDPTSDQHESGDIEISESHGDLNPHISRKPPANPKSSNDPELNNYNSKPLPVKEEKVKFTPQLINESAIYSEYNESVPEESMRELEESAIPTEHDDDEEDMIDEYSNDEFDEVDEDHDSTNGRNTATSKKPIQATDHEEAEEHYSEDAMEDEDDNGSYSRIVYDNNEDNHDEDSVSEGSVEDVLKSSKSKILSFADLAEHAGWNPETEKSPDPMMDSQKDLDVPEVSVAPQAKEPVPKAITSSLMNDNVLDLDKLVARASNRGVTTLNLNSVPLVEKKIIPEEPPKPFNPIIRSTSATYPQKEAQDLTRAPKNEVVSSVLELPRDTKLVGISNPSSAKDSRESEPPLKTIETKYQSNLSNSAAPKSTIQVNQSVPQPPVVQHASHSSVNNASLSPPTDYQPAPQPQLYPPQYQPPPPAAAQYPQQPPQPQYPPQYPQQYSSPHPPPYPAFPGYSYPTPPPPTGYPYPPSYHYPPPYGMPVPPPPNPYGYPGYYPGYPFPPSPYYYSSDTNFSSPPQQLPPSYHEIHQQKPVILELIQELNAAQAEANWAKEKLAETIVYLRKSGVASSMKSPMSTQENHIDRSSKAATQSTEKVEDNEKEDSSSDGGYSEDFETSQLNISSNSHHQPHHSSRNHSPRRSSRNVSGSWKSLPKVSEEPDIPGIASSRGGIEQEILEILRKGSASLSHGNRIGFHPPELSSGDPITDSVAKSFLASQELLRTKLDSLRLRLRATAKDSELPLKNPFQATTSVATSELQPSLQDLKAELVSQRRKSQERMMDFIRQKYPDIELDELQSFLTMTE